MHGDSRVSVNCSWIRHCSTRYVPCPGPSSTGPAPPGCSSTGLAIRKTEREARTATVRARPKVSPPPHQATPDFLPLSSWPGSEFVTSNLPLYSSFEKLHHESVASASSQSVAAPLTHPLIHCLRQYRPLPPHPYSQLRSPECFNDRRLRLHVPLLSIQHSELFNLVANKTLKAFPPFHLRRTFQHPRSRPTATARCPRSLGTRFSSSARHTFKFYERFRFSLTI